MYNRLTNRDYLKISESNAGSVVFSIGVAGCVHRDTITKRNNKADFKHGVASGDPLEDRVILWTRVTPEQHSDVTVSWQMATDVDFNNLVNAGSTLTNSERDYTVKVDAAGLEPGCDYYYRFIAGNKVSAVGRTRTLPRGDVEQVKFVLLNYTNDFNVYAEAAKIENADAALYLGDYIYEHNNVPLIAKESPIKSSNEQHHIAPTNDYDSLHVYRTRYAQHRSDTSLQSLHQKIALITLWDDQKVNSRISNEGADEDKWTSRRLAALQAYFEWMPIRPYIEEENLTINRQFKYGELVDLLMPDKRGDGREQQLNVEDYVDWTTMSVNIDDFQAAVDNYRSTVGKDQFNWLIQPPPGNR